MYRVLLLLVILFSPGYTKEAILRTAIESQVQEILSSSDISPEDIGIYVKSLSSGKVVYEKNADKSFIPASNQKVLTTASALLMLGPDFRFETRFLTDGKKEGAVLKGNIYIVGNFNPEIDQTYYEEFSKFLKNSGISKIDGDIIVYSNYHPNIQGWPEKDADYCFTAHPSDIPVAENCLRIRVTADGKIRVETIPDAYLDIVSDIKITRSGGEISAKLEGGRLYLSGVIRNGFSKEFSIPIKEPAKFNLLVAAKVLHRNGIQFGKLYVSRSLPQNLTLLYAHRSSPLRDIIKKANKDSNNFIAEQIYAFIGQQNIQKTLEHMRLPAKSINIADGSGLSRYNLVSPKIIGEVLEAVYKTPYFEDFFKSLAVSGKDGTLKHRFSDPQMFGKIYAKTGYIKGVKNLSGYAISTDGDVYIFSIMVNNLKSTKPANEIQERVCRLLVDTSSLSRTVREHGKVN